MNSKRQAVINKLSAIYERRARRVMDGDWSKEAVDKMSASKLALDNYSAWARTAPEGDAHPAEDYF